MGESVETSILFPLLLVFILVFTLAWPQQFTSLDRHAAEAMEAAQLWTADGPMAKEYVLGGKTLATQPEKLLQLLYLFRDLMGKATTPRPRNPVHALPAEAGK